jgi:hypothetical protein
MPGGSVSDCELWVSKSRNYVVVFRIIHNHVAL